MSCILCHQGGQLILAYSWARLAILVAGKDRGECLYFFCFFPFIPVPLSSLSLSFIFPTISSISFLPFSGRRHKMTHKGWCLVKPQHNNNSSPLSPQSLSFISTTISSISLLPFSRRHHKMTHKGWCFIKPQHNNNSSLSFFFLFLPIPSLSSLLSLLSLFSLYLGDNTKWPTRVDLSLNPQHNQYIVAIHTPKIIKK